MRSIKFFIAILSVSLLSACSKQLDILPPDLVVEDGAFTDIPSLEKGMIGVYAEFNGNFDDEIYATALYTDEATLPTENNTGRGVIAYRWQVDAGNGDVTAAWFDYYFAIDRANRIIAAGNKLTTNKTEEEALRKRIIGEATALRAYGHLQLLINFSENFNASSLAVPYMTVATIGKPTRETVGEVFTKINADLTTAEGLIPSSFTNNSRITLAAIHAIRARAALYAKDWDGAIAAATKAINLVPLASRSVYPQIWTDASEAEVIWKTKRVTGQGRIGDIFYDRGQAKIMYAVSFELLQSFDATNDIRYASTVFQRSGSDRYSVGKYIGGDPQEPNRADVKNFRTAEMYLIRAEAYAEKDKLAEGTKDLNDLRRVRIDGYADEVFSSKASLIEAILAERFKELAFEGHRMSDLRRHLLPVTRLPEDVINALGAVTLNPADKPYYYPIPLAEIQANENMVQNPAYR